MNIAWFSWKDVHHPLAGGAERVGHEWRRRLVLDGHAVRHVTAGYDHATPRETIDGVETIRCGRSAVLHYPAAFADHVRHTRDWADAIVEEVNTIPYFTRAALPRAPTVLLYYQLAREIWFYQTVLPVALVGYAAEALYTCLQAIGAPPVVTISEDSQRDLARFGFHPSRTHVVSVGIDNVPLTTYDPRAKESTFTVLFHGSLRAMKRPADALHAFRHFRASGGQGQLWISGGGPDEALRREIAAHGLETAVQIFGRTSEAQKLDLMRRASVLVSTSVKEGWGLIVTEANSMGTPALVYDVDGLRSAAGTLNWLSQPDPQALAARLHEVAQTFARRPAYDEWCMRTLEDSRRHTHDASYQDFRRALTASLRRVDD